MVYYVRKKNLYSRFSTDPFKLSRSKIELFVNCPRCFYLDRKLGIPHPDMPAFLLNSAVDILLKKEFDIHRAKNHQHPLMKAYKINAIPFSHPELDKWRNNFVGIQYEYKPANFIISGAIDDIWISPKGELIIVDYKSTSTRDEISLDGQYKEAYKRQMEIYQWLFQKNGFPVSSTGYFVYCNGLMDKEAFDGKLEFNIQVIPYKGDPGWVEDTLLNIKKCLDLEKPPKSSDNCDFCAYLNMATNLD